MNCSTSAGSQSILRQQLRKTQWNQIMNPFIHTDQSDHPILTHSVTTVTNPHKHTAQTFDVISHLSSVCKQQTEPRLPNTSSSCRTDPIPEQYQNLHIHEDHMHTSDLGCVVLSCYILYIIFIGTVNSFSTFYFNMKTTRKLQHVTVLFYSMLTKRNTAEVCVCMPFIAGRHTHTLFRLAVTKLQRSSTDNCSN